MQSKMEREIDCPFGKARFHSYSDVHCESSSRRPNRSDFPASNATLGSRRTTRFVSFKVEQTSEKIVLQPEARNRHCRYPRGPPSWSSRPLNRVYEIAPGSTLAARAAAEACSAQHTSPPRPRSPTTTILAHIASATQ